MSPILDTVDLVPVLLRYIHSLYIDFEATFPIS